MRVVWTVWRLAGRKAFCSVAATAGWWGSGLAGLKAFSKVDLTVDLKVEQRVVTTVSSKAFLSADY